MSKRCRLLLSVLLLSLPGWLAACGSDRADEAAAPIHGDERTAPASPPPGARPESIPHRRPTRHRTPELRPGDRPVYFELVLEGRATACWINGRRAGKLPEAFGRVEAVLASIESDPKHTVAVLDIHPRVSQRIVTGLITRLTGAGIKRMVFASTATGRRRG